METLSNEHLTIKVKEHGAELASIESNGREYLWQADESFWKRHSPVLFPIVGSLWNGECRSHGKTYKMGQHGFARDMDFVNILKTDTELRYRLVSDEITMQKYPYAFCLEIGYQLVGNRIKVLWHVENTGDEMMSFQIGAHPAFFWPMLSDEATKAPVSSILPALADTDSRGFFRIEANSSVLAKSVITEGGCIGAESQTVLDAEGYLPIDVNTFNDDALIYEDSQVTKVTLCRDDMSPYLSLEFTSPLVGLWSPPGKRAPFVCIEPWYGRADSAGYEGTYESKPWIQQIEAGKCFDASYEIVVEKQ